MSWYRENVEIHCSANSYDNDHLPLGRKRNIHINKKLEPAILLRQRRLTALIRRQGNPRQSNSNEVKDRSAAGAGRVVKLHVFISNVLILLTQLR